MSVKKYWWIFLIGAPAFALFLAAIRVYYSISIWDYSGPSVVFEVKPGEGFSSINGRLRNKHLISNAKIFHRFAQVKGYMSKFKAGQYEIKSGSNMLDVFDILTKGKSITREVTIPEGKNLFEIAKLLDAKGITKEAEFIENAKNPYLTKKMGIQGQRFEGYLYPETYRFTPGSSPEIILQSMVRVFNLKTKDLDFSKAPLRLTKHQVVILASVVEKETGAAKERPMIAGVFLNRLKKRMRLQSDPTTIYGIWEKYNGNLKKDHLLEKTPYNTYKINFLPQGPIANPGVDSIKAVLHPAKHKYLYFVSQNDGTHIFSETYRKHREAVNKYQKDWRMRKGKSWRQLKKK